MLYPSFRSNGSRSGPFRGLMLFALCAILLTGCTKSLRQDASKVASGGETVFKQMAEYYGLLQQDTLDTYELNAFREAYLVERKYEEQVKKAKENGQTPPTPPSLAMSATDEAILHEYQVTYRALAARARLAKEIERAYASYGRLADYDSTKELEDSIGGLIKAANSAASLSLPDPTGTISTVVQGLFKDLIKELGTIQHNRKLLRESRRLVPIVQKTKEIFDAEMPLYGGDKTMKDSQGKDREVSGIAGRRAATYKSVALELVESEAVDSTALVNRVLSQYQLHWPEPTMPFTQPGLKAGSMKMIIARAYPLMELSEDTGTGVSRALGKLLVLHEQLAAQKPFSMQELMSESATVQIMLDELESKGMPANFMTELLRANQKGGQP